MGKLPGNPIYIADSIVFKRTHFGLEAQEADEGENSTSLLIQYEQDWAGLFPSEITTKGSVMVFSGELTSMHSMVAILK